MAKTIILANKLVSQKGFGHTLLVCGLLVIIVLGAMGHRVYTNTKIRTDKDTSKVASAPAEESKQNEPATESPIAPTPTTNTEATPPSPKSTKPAPAPKPVAPAFTTSVNIKGDEKCQNLTLEALKLLSTRAPSHYSIVIKYVGIIECASQGSGMFAYESPPRYLVGNATRDAGTVWYAGTIAHDAGHSKLYHEYKDSHPGESVPNNVWMEESAERTCLEAQHDALTKIGGTQQQLDYVQNIINSQYYNVPYEQRWW